MEVFAPGLFNNETAIITGGGTGIGRAVALQLAKLGADVAICGRRQSPLDNVKSEIESLGRTCMAQSCDIREPDVISKFVADVQEKIGGCSVLINNAGGQFVTTAESLSSKGWNAVIRNNLNGTFFMTREVGVKLMIPEKRGRIVNIIANIERGFPGMVHTGAARAGVENLTRTLAVEWAQYGITTVALAPGFVSSSGTMQYPEELREMSRKMTPLKRWATVEEIAHLIVFMASPVSHYVTGCTVKSDGGASLWGENWEIPEHDNG